MIYPIIYKEIPVQFAFYVHADGRLQVEMLHPVKKETKFESEKAARDYVEKLTQIL